MRQFQWYEGCVTFSSGDSRPSSQGRSSLKLTGRICNPSALTSATKGKSTLMDEVLSGEDITNGLSRIKRPSS